MKARNYGFLLHNLVSRDFKLRYRNMSLGVFWSLLNPLVLMTVLWFVFTRIYDNSTPNFHVFVLSGLVVFNFFSLAWQSGTTSIQSNAGLIKRVPMPRELMPISTVLANSMHFLIQIVLLIVIALTAGYRPHLYWLLLPWIFALEVVFVIGLCLMTSALDVYFRDVRYVVESANLVLFWLVPIFYSFAMVPREYAPLYEYNPVAAVVLACRSIIMDAELPPLTLLWKLPLVSFVIFGLGAAVFSRLKKGFSDYL